MPLKNIQKCVYSLYAKLFSAVCKNLTKMAMKWSKQCSAVVKMMRFTDTFDRPAATFRDGAMFFLVLFFRIQYIMGGSRISERGGGALEKNWTFFRGGVVGWTKPHKEIENLYIIL
jgi:hypothetical protein